MSAQPLSSARLGTMPKRADRGERRPTRREDLHWHKLLVHMREGTIDIDGAIDDFLQARLDGIYFPPAWYDRLSLEDACRVQVGVLGRLIDNGATHIGWKVGLTAEAIQRQFRVHEPVFGFLLADGVHSSPAQLRVDSLIRPGIENEICATIGDTLRGPGVDEAHARSAVRSVGAAMELIETRGPFTEQLPVAIGENVQQKGVILSAATQPLGADFDLAGVQVELRRGGDIVERATGEAVLGNPLRSIVWLANKLAEYDLALESGQLVMTGSLTRQYLAQPGDVFEAVWQPFGSVTAEFI
jgi:2-keto-4-pentenoate hydratase